MRGTTVHYASPEWVNLLQNNQRGLPDGRWVPARYYGNRTSLFERLGAAWLVFTGKADALVWMEDYYGRSHSNGVRQSDG
ncbi:hypothetical protein [Bradyrhizobium japonicum]|uniref:hypothetical protein n=1 Tax=Bradyrhizobium japonicum TaxID=375 RepID=UPI0012BCAD6A|nr:hypothetical protein [Bradyrhizobium japonicum]